MGTYVVSKFFGFCNIYESTHRMQMEDLFMKQAYPVLIAQHGAVFLVYIPDMDIYTEGISIVDAIEMARDAIGLKGIDLEDDGIELPIPSTSEEALRKAKKDTEDFDYSTGEYRRKHENKTVRRNVTLPNWLNIEAEKARINVSKVLQEALKEKLQVTK